MKITISPVGINLPHVLLEIENQAIDDALKLTDGNKTNAAKLLGIHRTTLVEKLRKRGLIQKAKKRHYYYE